MENRSYTAGGQGYRFGFQGQEMDDEVRGQGNSLDFGARIYDSRLGRFFTRDNFESQFAHQTPYAFAGNTPIMGVDVNGDSLYILSYVGGSFNGMFYASAYTRKYDIENSEHFDPARDKVVILEVNDLADINQLVTSTVKEFSGKYGKTVEFGIWSHSGLDGPIGSEPTSNNALDEGSPQMSFNGWGEIDLNWASGDNCRAGFYGCNSGNESRGENLSFTTKLSGLSNFSDVNVLGQTTSSYPSIYTNTRSLALRQLLMNYGTPLGDTDPVSGDAIDKSVGRTYKTYMVGGDAGESSEAFFGGTNANPMTSSKNGKTESKNNYQRGDKKK